MSASAPLSAADHKVIVLALSSLGELFSERAPDPLAPFPHQVLGRRAIDQLHSQFLLRWPKQQAATTLIVRLPSAAFAASPGTPALPGVAQQVAPAISRYCTARVEQSVAAQRLVLQDVRKQTPQAVLLVILSVLLVAVFEAYQLALRFPFITVVLTLLSIFAAIVAIWDLLWTLLFDRTPHIVEARAFRWIGTLQVQVEPWSPIELSAAARAAVDIQPSTPP
ncbi:MAG: hypothetical protein ACRC1H_10185 [Caldilineaceae bacterium]